MSSTSPWLLAFQPQSKSGIRPIPGSIWNHQPSFLAFLTDLNRCWPMQFFPHSANPMSLWNPTITLRNWKTILPTTRPKLQLSSQSLGNPLRARANLRNLLFCRLQSRGINPNSPQYRSRKGIFSEYHQV